MDDTKCVVATDPSQTNALYILKSMHYPQLSQVLSCDHILDIVAEGLALLWCPLSTSFVCANYKLGSSR